MIGVFYQFSPLDIFEKYFCICFLILNMSHFQKMKNKLLIFFLVFPVCFSITKAQERPILNEWQIGGTTVLFSQGQEVSAQFSGEVCYEANSFFQRTLDDLEVDFKIYVLSKEDWAHYTDPNLIYGMPHFVPKEKRLVVAAEDNSFWRMQLPDFSSLSSPYKELFPMTYSFNDKVSSRYFFDLLPIHELGHAWASKAGLNTQRRWLSEMLCNLMLHTFIAEERGEFLGALELLPMYWSNEDRSIYTYRSLEEFQDNYGLIAPQSPRNYAWYQFRFHNAARMLYNEGGADVLINLWSFLSNSEETLEDEALLAGLRDEVHPYFEELWREW